MVLGFVVGAVVGLALGELVAPVKNLIERLWKGKDRIMKERQEKVERQLRKILKDADGQVRQHAEEFGKRFHQELHSQMDQRTAILAIEKEETKNDFTRGV